MIRGIETVKGNTYYNQRRFEASISNFGIRRQRQIEIRRRFKLFDVALVIGILFLALFLAVEIFAISKEKLSIMAKNRDIKFLEASLDRLVSENDNYLELIRNKVDITTLKRIAYIDLGMIAPTDKNIIYFDKSDTIDVPVS